MGYQYLMSTVPYLQRNSAAPMSAAGFLELAVRHLSAADASAATALADGSATGNGFVNAWRDYDTQLRNASARIRASRLGKDSAPWTRAHGGFDPSLERLVAAAFQEQDPLLREKALDGLRWTRIEELAGFDAFSASAVFAYYLKLQLLEKAASRSTAEGGKILAGIINGAEGEMKTISKS